MNIDYRPGWHEYFLWIAQVISLRSDDRFIKHGAVLIDRESKHILSTGYNGTIPGANMSIVRPENREHRRFYMQHAEKNLILNSSVNPKRLNKKVSAYVTGLPCINCLQDLIAFGVMDIHYLDRQATITEDSKTAEIRANLLKMSKINLVKYQWNKEWHKLIPLNFI